MSVLVTGGAGFIGSHMALGLLDRGEDVVVLDDLSTGFDWAVPAGARFVRGRIQDRSLVASLLREYGVNAVIHFAGSLQVAESVTVPLAYYGNNTGGLCDLLDETVAAGVEHIVFSSTAAVYASRDEAIDETASLAPISPYGRSKLMAEQILADAARAHGFRQATLRYFNVAGADPERRAGQASRDATHLLKVALETAVGRRSSMSIFGTDYATPDGTAIRDYVHVTDLIAAHLAALDRMRAGGSDLIANVGYGRGHSVRDVLSVVEQVTGRTLAVHSAPRRAGDPASLVADSTLLRENTGWAPRHDDLTEIVRHAFAFEEHLLRRNH